MGKNLPWPLFTKRGNSLLWKRRVSPPSGEARRILKICGRGKGYTTFIFFSVRKRIEDFGISKEPKRFFLGLPKERLPRERESTFPPPGHVAALDLFSRVPHLILRWIAELLLCKSSLTFGETGPPAGHAATRRLIQSCSAPDPAVDLYNRV